MVGHRIMGSALACTGSPAQAREHYDRALTMYDPALHRAFAMRFQTDIRAGILSFARGPCGSSAIRRPHSRMSDKLSLTHKN